MTGENRKENNGKKKPVFRNNSEPREKPNGLRKVRCSEIPLNMNEAKEGINRRTILKDPMPPGFSKLPAKKSWIRVGQKRSGHHSSGLSGGRFGKPPEKSMLVGFFDLRKFRYSQLYSEPNTVIAWAEMSLNMDHMNREVASLGFFEKAGEKTREILGLVKYALICGADGYRNPMVQWPSWVADTSLTNSRTMLLLQYHQHEHPCKLISGWRHMQTGSTILVGCSTGMMPWTLTEMSIMVVPGSQTVG